MDIVENSTLEIGSGEDLSRALHAVDVAKGKISALVGFSNTSLCCFISEPFAFRHGNFGFGQRGGGREI